MTGGTDKILMNARCHCLLDFDVAVLAPGLAFDMPHAARPGLVAVDAYDLLRHMNVLGQARGFGIVLPEVAVPPAPFHGSRVADERAPASPAAVRRWRCPAEGVAPALPGGRVVAIEAARMADVACLLFGNRLLTGKGKIDLLDDLFRVFKGEPVAFRPADRPGVRKGRPSVVRPVNVVPDGH